MLLRVLSHCIWQMVCCLLGAYQEVSEADQPHEAEANQWEFSFLKQTRPKVNIFNANQRIACGHHSCLMLKVTAPAPSSSSRTRLMKLNAADFKTVQKMFWAFCKAITTILHETRLTSHKRNCLNYLLYK